MQREVVLAMEQVVGATHPSILTVRSNLAVTLRQRGDLKGAVEQQTAVVQARTQILGDSHPDTLTSKENLAQAITELTGPSI